MKLFMLLISICILTFNFLLSFDFMFEENYLYKLDNSNIMVKNNEIEVEYNNFNKINQLNKSIISDISKVVFNQNLNYYYHTNKHKKYVDNVIELKKNGNVYKAIAKIKSYDNCFLIIKNITIKKMLVKNRSMLVDIDNLYSIDDSKIYLKCLENMDYIN